jgi:hypothetical protein
MPMPSIVRLYADTKKSAPALTMGRYDSIGMRRNGKKTEAATMVVEDMLYYLAVMKSTKRLHVKEGLSHQRFFLQVALPIVVNNACSINVPCAHSHLSAAAPE